MQTPQPRRQGFSRIGIFGHAVGRRQTACRPAGFLLPGGNRRALPPDGRCQPMIPRRSRFFTRFLAQGSRHGHARSNAAGDRIVEFPRRNRAVARAPRNPDLRAFRSCARTRPDARRSREIRIPGSKCPVALRQRPGRRTACTTSNISPVAVRAPSPASAINGIGSRQACRVRSAGRIMPVPAQDRHRSCRQPPATGRAGTWRPSAMDTTGALRRQFQQGARKSVQDQRWRSHRILRCKAPSFSGPARIFWNRTDAAATAINDGEDAAAGEIGRTQARRNESAVPAMAGPMIRANDADGLRGPRTQHRYRSRAEHVPAAISAESAGLANPNPNTRADERRNEQHKTAAQAAMPAMPIPASEQCPIDRGRRDCRFGWRSRAYQHRLAPRTPSMLAPANRKPLYERTPMEHALGPESERGFHAGEYQRYPEIEKHQTAAVGTRQGR